MYVNTNLVPHITSGIIENKLDGVETAIEGCLVIGGRTMPNVYNTRLNHRSETFGI